VLGQFQTEPAGDVMQITAQRLGGRFVSDQPVADCSHDSQRRDVLAGEAQLDAVPAGAADSQRALHGREQRGVLSCSPVDRDLKRPGWKLPGSSGGAEGTNFRVHSSPDGTLTDLNPKLIEWLSDDVVKVEIEDRRHLLVAASDSLRESDLVLHRNRLLSRSTVASADDAR